MLEKEIEKKVCAYAKSKGWLCYKFPSPSQRGVPDRIYMKSGLIFFIEFKAPGKRATKLQDKVISTIILEDFTVHVVDNVAQGKNIVDAHTLSGRLVYAHA